MCAYWVTREDFPERIHLMFQLWVAFGIQGQRKRRHSEVDYLSKSTDPDGPKTCWRRLMALTGDKGSEKIRP